jgi:putative oxidoreductase
MTTRLRERTWSAVHALLRSPPHPAGSDVALVATRTVLTWIFVYYGAGKLFGAFNGPGIHRTSIYFANTAHLHPGGFFAVLGGVIEFGGALCVGLGLATRLAGLALFGDQVMAMITVTWTNGINSLTTRAGYEFNMTLAVLALILVIFGAGRLSVDAVLERRTRHFFLARCGPTELVPQDSPATVHHSSLT